MSQVDVTRIYLELARPERVTVRSAGDASVLGADVRLELAEPCPVPFYRALYREVGRDYHWRDRAAWSDEQVTAHLARATITIWVLYVRDEPAGYFELERHDDGSVEIVHFGLLPGHVGRGLGKQMLTAAIERAWETGTKRLWLHTCSLDSPAALPNYLARGFRPFKQERYTVEMDG
jgi:GNAT superfamily N-acetyltransferase